MAESATVPGLGVMCWSESAPSSWDDIRCVGDDPPDPGARAAPRGCVCVENSCRGALVVPGPDWVYAGFSEMLGMDLRSAGGADAGADAPSLVSAVGTLLCICEPGVAWVRWDLHWRRPRGDTDDTTRLVHHRERYRAGLQGQYDLVYAAT